MTDYITDSTKKEDIMTAPNAGLIARAARLGIPTEGRTAEELMQFIQEELDEKRDRELR